MQVLRLKAGKYECVVGRSFFLRDLGRVGVAASVGVRASSRKPGCKAGAVDVEDAVGDAWTQMHTLRTQTTQRTMQLPSSLMPCKVHAVATLSYSFALTRNTCSCYMQRHCAILEDPVLQSNVLARGRPCGTRYPPASFI